MRFACCFCGESSDSESRESLTLVVAASSASEGEHPTQQMFCHAECLAQRLSPNVPFDAEAFHE
jgi:hypothetical protein